MPDVGDGYMCVTWLLCEEMAQDSGRGYWTSWSFNRLHGCVGAHISTPAPCRHLPLALFQWPEQEPASMPAPLLALGGSLSPEAGLGWAASLRSAWTSG